MSRRMWPGSALLRHVPTNVAAGIAATNVATHRSGCSFKPAAAITLRHVSTLNTSGMPTPEAGPPAGPPGARHAEGRTVEQRDTLRRHRRHLGGRAHPPVASPGLVIR